MEKEPHDTVFSLKQAAFYAHVSRQAVYLAIKFRGLKAEMRCKRWYIKKSDYDEWRANKYNRTKKKIAGEYVFDLSKGHFSIPQLAQMLSECRGYFYPSQRLYYLLRKGKLRGSRVGGEWVINQADAKALFEAELHREKIKSLSN